MPGPVILDPAPEWLKQLRPENASVLDPAWKAPARTVIKLLGLDDPQSQALGLMTGLETKEAQTLLERFPRLAKVIKAFHGTPHHFNAERFIQHADGRTEFIVGAPDVLPDVPEGATVLKDFPLGRQRLDKIGTGEGAQMAGKGLYQGEAEGTAEAYRQKLTREAGVHQPEQLAEYFKPGRIVSGYAGKDRVLEFRRDPGAGMDWAVKVERVVQDKQTGEWVSPSNETPRWHRTAPSAAEFEAVTDQRLGKVYEVDIHAKPEDFMDWDKPINQQKEKVDRVLQTLGFTREHAMRIFQLADEHPNLRNTPEYRVGRMLVNAESVPGQFAKGSDLLHAIGDEHADVFRRAGIPGVKFLDQNSRIRGESAQLVAQYGGDRRRALTVAQNMLKKGTPLTRDYWRMVVDNLTNPETYNYVVFDDAILDLKKKWGLLLPAAIGAKIEYLRQKAQRQGGKIDPAELVGL